MEWCVESLKECCIEVGVSDAVTDMAIWCEVQVAASLHGAKQGSQQSLFNLWQALWICFMIGKKEERHMTAKGTPIAYML